MAMSEAKRLYLAFLPGRLRQIRPADDDDLIAAADHIDAQATELTRLRAQVREGYRLLAIHAVTCPFAPDEPDAEVYSCAMCLAQADTREAVQHEPHCALTPQPALAEGGKG